MLENPDQLINTITQAVLAASALVIAIIKALKGGK